MAHVLALPNVVIQRILKRFQPNAFAQKHVIDAVVTIGFSLLHAHPAQILRDYGAKVRSFCGRQTCIGFGGLFALRYLIMVLGSQPTGIRQNQEGSLWQSMAEIPAQSGKVTLREDPQSSGNA